MLSSNVINDPKGDLYTLRYSEEDRDVVRRIFGTGCWDRDTLALMTIELRVCRTVIGRQKTFGFA